VEPGLLYPHLAHHLAHDDLDVLVVQIDALLAVHLLDFLGDIGAHAGTAELVVVDAADAQHIVGIERAGGELLALVHMVARVDENAGGVGRGVNKGLALRLVDNGDGVT
jgi:hypothetical protein